MSKTTTKTSKTKKTSTRAEKPKGPQAEKTTQPPGQDTKIIAAIGYVWILFLVPLLIKKEDAYAQFHAKQGLILFVTSFVVMILGVIPVLGWILSFFGWIAIFIFSVTGIVKSLQGEEWPMPYLGKFAKKIDV